MKKKHSKISSGKFVLRIPEKTHDLLKKGAKHFNISLNDYCRTILEMGMSNSPLDSRVLSAVQAAREFLEDDLIAVIVYGSWARDTQTTSSDIDIAVIIDAKTTINRSLYKSWDLVAHELDESLQINFLHLPSGQFSSLWCELAIDGMIIHDSQNRLTKVLMQVRQDIANGQWQRQFSHGAPYWTRKDQVS